MFPSDYLPFSSVSSVNLGQQRTACENKEHYSRLMAAGWRTGSVAVSGSRRSHDDLGREIIGRSQLHTCTKSLISFESAAWPLSVTCYNDDECLTNRWVMIKFTPNCFFLFRLYCFLWHTCSAQTGGPATTVQTRCLCLASWQMSEALTYWKYALAHMWQQCGASILEWFRAEPKKHGRAGTHDLFWQNQEIPLILLDINHCHAR